MELYREIGRVLSGRLEKGAAVTASEYLQSAYPDAAGFSPRSLRRIRDFYRTYEGAPEVMARATAIGRTRNIVIMEAELTFQEKAWQIRGTLEILRAHGRISTGVPEPAEPPDCVKLIGLGGTDTL